MVKEKKKVRMQTLFGSETEVTLSGKFGSKAEKNKYRQSSCSNYKKMSYDDPKKTEEAHRLCELCRLNNSETSKTCHDKKTPPKPKMTFAKQIKARQAEKERVQLQPNPQFER